MVVVRAFGEPTTVAGRIVARAGPESPQVPGHPHGRACLEGHGVEGVAKAQRNIAELQTFLV